MSVRSQVENLHDFIHGRVGLREFLERDPSIRDPAAELERLVVEHRYTIEKLRAALRAAKEVLDEEGIRVEEVDEALGVTGGH